MTKHDWIEHYIDLYQQDYERRLQEQVGKGLYPTAWGLRPEFKSWYKGPHGDKTLRRWCALAVRNIVRNGLGKS
jgi:hypothetical protein